jgi:site-specific DNA recombinase
MELFDAVQAQLAANHHRRTTRKTRAAACPLTGRIFDADGQPMRPSFSYGRGRRMYRYYVSECLLPSGRVTNGGNLQGTRLPATQIEKLLVRAITELLPEPQDHDEVFTAITRVVATPTQLEITLDVDRLVSQNFSFDMLLSRVQQQIDTQARFDGDKMTFALDIPAGRRGRTISPGIQRRSDEVGGSDVADLLRTAHRKLGELNASPLELGRHAMMRAPVDAWTRQRLAVGLLAPDIQRALLQGTLPRGIDADALLAINLPLDWNEQRRVMGIDG